MLASTGDTRIGMAASYVLFGSGILSFTSARRWSLSLSVASSLILACYFLPNEIRNAIFYPQAIIGTTESVAIHTAFILLIGLSLTVSIKHLRASLVAE
jgi:hypothetical protein